jgi:heat shock protein HtpX
MNVYEQIEANTRRTTVILFAFPVALAVTIFLFSYLMFKTEILKPDDFAFISKYYAKAGALRHAFQLTLKVCPWVFLVAFLWIAFSYYNNGAMILGLTKAKEITFDEDRELYRLVENTAIMVGVPTPKIYFIDDESMNTFATGREPKTSSIALTKGIVNKLNKTELQAVIAHELAHIANRDTTLMLIVVAGIGCFTFLGEALFRAALRSGRGRKNNKGTVFLLIIGIACLIFGYIVAPILRFSLSRRREYQADATAAKVIHDPNAVALALSKIASDSNVEFLNANLLVGNICIADPAKKGRLSFVSQLYATHPPIEDRIAALRRMMVRGKALY